MKKRLVLLNPKYKPPPSVFDSQPENVNIKEEPNNLESDIAAATFAPKNDADKIQEPIINIKSSDDGA